MGVVEKMRCPKLPEAPMMEPGRVTEITVRYLALIEEGR
jgi:hypothetical protein